MFKPKIKLEKALRDRVVRASAEAGYASPEEFVRHVLEREIAKIEKGDTDAEVEKQLRGLGYIE